MMSYQAQLKQPEWQRRRMEMLERADCRCQHCDTRDESLEIHHHHYVPSRFAWEYTDDELMVLCKSCHQEIHSIIDFFGVISRDPALARCFAALITGFCNSRLELTPDSERVRRILEAADAMVEKWNFRRADPAVVRSHTFGVLANQIAGKDWPEQEQAAAKLAPGAYAGPTH